MIRCPFERFISLFRETFRLVKHAGDFIFILVAGHVTVSQGNWQYFLGGMVGNENATRFHRGHWLSSAADSVCRDSLCPRLHWFQQTFPHAQARGVPDGIADQPRFPGKITMWKFVNWCHVMEYQKPRCRFDENYFLRVSYALKQPLSRDSRLILPNRLLF